MGAVKSIDTISEHSTVLSKTLTHGVLWNRECQHGDRSSVGLTKRGMNQFAMSDGYGVASGKFSVVLHVVQHFSNSLKQFSGFIGLFYRCLCPFL